MKNKTLLIVLLLSSVFSAGVSYATPMTFSFNMPAFNSGALSGQTSILDVTVDNGSSSSLFQSFLNTDIISYLADIGGNSSSSTGAGYYSGSVVFITTDAAGIPTLDLTSSVSAYANTTSNITFIQLGTGSFTDYCVDRSCSIGGITQIVGQVVGGGAGGTVPSPATLALLGLGLAGLGWSRRKKA